MTLRPKSGIKGLMSNHSVALIILKYFTHVPAREADRARLKANLADESDQQLSIENVRISYPYTCSIGHLQGVVYNDLKPEPQGRVFYILRENNPELAINRLRTVMRPPQVLWDGTKKTLFVNFMDLCKTDLVVLIATYVKNGLKLVTAKLWNDEGKRSLDGLIMKKHVAF